VSWPRREGWRDHHRAAWRRPSDRGDGGDSLGAEQRRAEWRPANWVLGLRSDAGQGARQRESVAAVEDASPLALDDVEREVRVPLDDELECTLLFCQAATAAPHRKTGRTAAAATTKDSAADTPATSAMVLPDSSAATLSACRARMLKRSTARIRG
jgi:hypothetical protein